MDRGNKAIIILSILTVIFTIMGGTFAYWNWQSSSEQNTAVTFTVASGFSCSADGGGSISSNDKVLAPAACTNTTYAIKRTITVSPTITQPNKTIYLDMWLKVKNIGTELSNSVNMKYALTTSDTNCTTNVVSTGNFHNATTNTQIELLHYKEYSSTTTETYYLWIWLDSAETDPVTQNQTFNIELGGNCTDGNPFVYTANIYDENDEENSTVWIGQSIPNAITKYYDPNGGTQAITALETAYQTANNGATTNLPFFLRHVVANNNVTESYVGFVVTSAMAQANTGMTAGTYYLRGLDIYDTSTWECKSQYQVGNDCISPYYETNKATLLKAFGSTNCDVDSSNISCFVSGLDAGANSDGRVLALDDVNGNCGVGYNGALACYVAVGGGGGVIE